MSKIEETKSKQNDGIKKILTKHFTDAEIGYCFPDDTLEVMSEREIKSFTPEVTSTTVLSATKQTSEASTTTTTITSRTTTIESSEETKDTIFSTTISYFSSTIIEEDNEDYTPASTTVFDARDASASSSDGSTDVLSISGDRGTTPR